MVALRCIGWTGGFLTCFTVAGHESAVRSSPFFGAEFFARPALWGGKELGGLAGVVGQTLDFRV